MRKLEVCIAACIFITVGAVQAQDSTVYIFGLPVTEDDTANQFLRPDPERGNKLIPLAPDALPEKVFRALSEERQYKGWQDSTVFLDKETGLFIVPIKKSDGVRIFGLNEDGHAVTFDQVSPDPD